MAACCGSPTGSTPAATPAGQEQSPASPAPTPAPAPVPVSAPPVAALCADDCRASVDEVIAGTAANRNLESLGFVLDQGGSPHVVSPADAGSCGAADPAIEAVRGGSGWNVSVRQWDLGVTLARAGSNLGLLTDGNSPRFWLSTGNSGWENVEAPPIGAAWRSTLTGDSSGRFHLMGAVVGSDVPVYAVRDGTWRISPLALSAEESGALTPFSFLLSMALTVDASNDAHVAYWFQGKDNAVNTLYVGTPLGTRMAAMTGRSLSNQAGIALAVASDSGVDVSHVLAVRLSGPNADPILGPQELVYATDRGGAWTSAVVATGSAQSDCVYAADGTQTCQMDELNLFPIAVVTRGSDVRLLYTTDHLTGTVITGCHGAVCGTSGGTRTQDLMIGWVADGQVHTRRIAAGFVHSPGDAFSGRMRPYAHVQLDHEGRIHIVGEQTVAGVSCGSLLRYVVID